MALPNSKVQRVNLHLVKKQPLKKRGKEINLSTMVVNVTSHLPKIEMTYLPGQELSVKSVLRALFAVVCTNLTLGLYLLLTPLFGGAGYIFKRATLIQLSRSSHLSYWKVFVAYAGTAFFSYVVGATYIENIQLAGAANPLIVIGALICAIFFAYDQGHFKKN